jgi:cellulose synthase/poly-beta-1,6-N-acetylglucosamine synthase-like glycosyltransferase
MTILLILVLLTLAIPAVTACVYLLAQTLLSWRLPPTLPSTQQLRFDIVVPAHNEAAGIAQTVANLRELAWPPDRYRILVVADNCSDATAGLASAAGATVLERHNPVQRGKGYALLYAFRHCSEQQWSNAVVVVDADARVSANLLEAFASRIERGAHAVQAHYGILNPYESWRTRILTIAMTAYHVVRSRARERLGMSCGIRGNGWCVTHELIRQVPYNSFSLTEDIEYGILLGLAGYRVYYAGEVEASQEMPSDSRVASKQRQRWEQGRFDLIRSRTLPLLRAALLRRNAVCFDLALDLIVLPLTYVAVNVAALVLVAALACWHSRDFAPWLTISLGCTGALILYVLRGWGLSGTGARGLVDLLAAPVFIAWKLLLLLSRSQNGEWVRTERKPP